VPSCSTENILGYMEAAIPHIEMEGISRVCNFWKILYYRITGNFCGQLRTAEIKIAEYYVK
jgi:hypothetical protein